MISRPGRSSFNKVDKVVLRYTLLKWLYASINRVSLTECLVLVSTGYGKHCKLKCVFPHLLQAARPSGGLAGLGEEERATIRERVRRSVYNDSELRDRLLELLSTDAELADMLQGPQVSQVVGWAARACE